MYMDISIPLWPFFDIFGKTKAIRLIRPREGLFRRPASLDTDDEEIITALRPSRPPPPRFRSLLSESDRLSSNSSNDMINDDVEDEITLSYRRNRDRLLEEANINASNTINQVRESVPETRTTPVRTLDTLQRTQEFLNTLSARLDRINVDEPRTTTNLNVPSTTTLGLQSHSATNLQTQTTPVLPSSRSLRSSLTSVSSLPKNPTTNNRVDRPNIPPRSREATPSS
uniref:NHR domain-containing protein n=1 Tax=Panagrolaimus sp. JU765 TaxID=591449 RepID=A0AC34RAN4_9BILA